ncbi:DUF397 domain-containing protein [Amycolatopsis anabasis]|uniref:DUF397 domain-containing protein n=1 Tax=Amycolatopsis anabasis TaxID=1840409 RepID=UPI00131B796F|nr:DUF397 domain-containing protein [Amycolatopsis anabasis]
MSIKRTWRKSSRSSAENACVELSVGQARTSIRDTKNPCGGVLTVDAAAFGAFLALVKTGRRRSDA